MNKLQVVSTRTPLMTDTFSYTNSSDSPRLSDRYLTTSTSLSVIIQYVLWYLINTTDDYKYTIKIIQKYYN